MAQLLLVEDHQSIASGIIFALENHGYQVTYCSTLPQAQHVLASNEHFDLCIFDILLGDDCAFDLKTTAPILYLSAKDDFDTIQECLQIGQYMNKPFNNNELVVRVATMIQQNACFQVNNLCIDTQKMIVSINDNQIELTSLEYKLLLILVRNKNKVITRDYLINEIWNITGNDVNDNTITVYLKRIRDKVGSNVITTIKGVGYVIYDKTT